MLSGPPTHVSNGENVDPSDSVSSKVSERVLVCKSFTTSTLNLSLDPNPRVRDLGRKVHRPTSDDLSLPVGFRRKTSQSAVVRAYQLQSFRRKSEYINTRTPNTGRP